MNRLLHTYRYSRSLRGFSYVELIVAIFLISIALVPALESIQGAQKGSAVYQSLSVQHYHLTAKVEEVLAQPFAALESAAINAGSATVATSYSDAGGSTNRRLVYLSAYDGDNADADNDPFTGVDDDLIWLQVSIENSAQKFETLVSK